MATSSGPTSLTSIHGFSPVRLIEKEPERPPTQKGRENALATKTKTLLQRFASLEKRLSEFEALRLDFESSGEQPSLKTFRPIGLKYNSIEDCYRSCGELAQDVITLSQNKAILINTYQGRFDEYTEQLTIAYDYVRIADETIRRELLSPTSLTTCPPTTSATTEAFSTPSVNPPPAESFEAFLENLNRQTDLGFASGDLPLTTTASGGQQAANLQPEDLVASERSSRKSGALSAKTSDTLSTIRRARLREKAAHAKAEVIRAKADAEMNRKLQEAKEELERRRLEEEAELERKRREAMQKHHFDQLDADLEVRLAQINREAIEEAINE